ncbi:Ras, Miro, and/or Arf domain containing protein [Asbolus verrucosus]|uniref:Ras, Miro, and/or Arf domain containing protein n=1 Tax=Asbolus verrucosus TaxID=1661398 RepID=A0A482VWK1_ASBVE|nr:Ras, Miro, and/or Arf domain containing protein [Asbolus verrucosus]
MVTKKIVVVGDGACGKTSLSVVFSRNEFPDEHIPTIYDTYTKTISVDDQNVELAIWDTAGEEDYDRLRPLSYSRANAILVCFSIDSPQSLLNVTEKWAPELKYHCRKVPLLLIGNKMDLRNNNDVINELNKYDLHPVQFEEGMKVAKKIKAQTYMECSAKFLIGVKEVFSQAAHISLKSTNRNKFIHCICTHL